MEKVIEFVLMFLWDALKPLILQWLVDLIKESWIAVKNYMAVQYA